MRLSNEQIREQVTRRTNRPAISRAIAHQNRIKFHAQTRLSHVANQPVSDFTAWVRSLIPADKFKIFMTLFRYPVFTNEVTGIVFDRLSRIFDGRNPAFNYQFTTSEQRNDWEDYRLNVLREPQVWQTEGWEQFKTEINSVLVVDLPDEQTSTQPEPYFYWLPIDQVLAYEADPSTSVFEWLAFEQEGERIAVIDDSSYRVFTKKNGTIDELISEKPHDLGYCPARFFWTDPVSINDPDVKASPLSKELEALDWLLFFHLSKRHLDLYGAYPIYSGYEQDCNYSDSATGDYCDGGFLRNKSGQYLFDSSGAVQRCPVCGDKRIAGVGSFVEVPVPRGDQPDLRNPVQMLSVDTASLGYNVNEVERLRLQIITAVTGVDNDVIGTEAVNEKQVSANFESQTTILNRIKKGFEAAQQFIDETVCRLRYGNQFVSATINYGTEFYMLTPTELRERYRIARDNGASEAELDALHDQIIETEYRHDPTQKQRMLVLAELEPYRHLSRSEVIGLHQSGIISDEDMRIKMNFANFVRRFERENTNILEFGSAIAYASKIERIATELRKYANESLTNIE